VPEEDSSSASFTSFKFALVEHWRKKGGMFRISGENQNNVGFFQKVRREGNLTPTTHAQPFD
jgi:hypothetical protein